MITQQWSPEQITGYCKTNNLSMVSHEWIYQYVYKDLKTGGQLYKNLRTQNKKRRKRMHRKDKRGLIPNRIFIHNRPPCVQEKQRFGDWEIDLIEGLNHKSFALTLVERKSQFALIVKADEKQASTIQTKIVNGLASYKELVRTALKYKVKPFYTWIRHDLKPNYQHAIAALFAVIIGIKDF